MVVIKFLFKLVLKIVIVVLFLIGIALVAFNWPVKDMNENMVFGISFSQIQARALELDWKKTYIAMLEDLRPSRIRIGAYWDEIESERGQYDFSDLDWQLDEAAKRNTEVILAFGIKAPRWPECHIPEFYLENKAEREAALLKYEKELVNRYKHRDNIPIWQVENEPFLAFGDCIEGAIDDQLLVREVKLVKELDDSRPIMTTDGGEFGDWYRAARRGDIFGSTLYRIIYKEPYKYFHYHLGPSYFRIKGGLTKILTGVDEIMISELQAEPWGPDWLPHMTIEEQYKSMSPEKLEEIVEYTKKTKFTEAYFWGVEWWYWMKATKDNDEMWETAKKVMTQRGQTTDNSK